MIPFIDLQAQRQRLGQPLEDAILKVVGAKIKHHWNCRKPHYLRLQDRIVLPPRTTR